MISTIHPSNPSGPPERTLSIRLWPRCASVLPVRQQEPPDGCDLDVNLTVRVALLPHRRRDHFSSVGSMGHALGGGERRRRTPLLYVPTPAHVSVG